MVELPLFPLHTVLFPGMPIHLHIFEDRYKEMIDLCERTGKPFGVVLIERGTEALGSLAEPYSVGCTAYITQIERLDDGHMNILAVGLERFQIHTLAYDRPYLMGTVELLPMILDNRSTITQAGRRLRPWVERYLTMLSDIMHETDFEPDHLPNDPMALTYLAAAVLQIPPDQKQSLLSSRDAVELLTEMIAIYRREVALLRTMITQSESEQQHSFSRN